MKRVWTGLAALGVFVGIAAAQGTLVGYTGDVTIQGTVSGSGTAKIVAYNNGLPVATAESGFGGSFSVKVTLSGDRDETVIVWFIPEEEGKVPELLILKESSSARRFGIWSPCIPRREPTDILLYDVAFKTEKELLESLEGNECFGQQASG